MSAVAVTGGAPAAGVGPAMGADPGVAGGALIPPPAEGAVDPMYALQLQLMKQSGQAVRRGEHQVEQQKVKRDHFRAEQREAMRRAAEAEAQKNKGFFDSIGLGGIAGIVTAQPVLVLADISVHMAGLVPEDFAALEKDALEVVNAAADGALGADAAFAFLRDAAGGPQAMMASLVLAGMIVEKSEVLGEQASAWVGAATACASGNARLAAVKILSDKDSAVAEDVRMLERQLGPDFMKYAQLAATIVAGVALAIGTAGAATPAVAVGLSLSAAGFCATEIKAVREALADAVGEEAAQWIALGASTTGAVITGVAGATAAQGAMNAGRLVAAGVQGTVKGVDAFRTLRDTTAQYRFDEAMIDKKEQDIEIERVKAAVSAIAERMQGELSYQQKVSELVSSYFDARLAESRAAQGMRG
ncbi:MAG: hypothetical protein KC657_31520 [Myxococcales bacterium]|nr:hypothetical protein [Myxococcales bacterium]